MFTVLGTIWHLHVETKKEPESIIALTAVINTAKLPGDHAGD